MCKKLEEQWQNKPVYEAMKKLQDCNISYDRGAIMEVLTEWDSFNFEAVCGVVPKRAVITVCVQNE